LGDVTHTTETLPTDYLTRLSAAVLTREPPPDVPERVRQMPGDIIVALSDGDFMSFARRLPSGARVLVGIRSDQLPPLSLPNVGRNVIAHELGHAIGRGITMIRRRSCVAGPVPSAGVPVGRGEVFPADGGEQDPAVRPLSPELGTNPLTRATTMGTAGSVTEATTC
jgi:hypothetical protein